MGAEKWLDIELWDSTKECFKMLKSRGYRIATTHVGMDTVWFASTIFNSLCCVLLQISTSMISSLDKMVRVVLGS